LLIVQATGVVRVSETAVPSGDFSCTPLAWPFPSNGIGMIPILHTTLNAYMREFPESFALEMENFGCFVFRIIFRTADLEIMEFTYLTDDEDLIEETYRKMQRVDFLRISRYLARYGEIKYLNYVDRHSRRRRPPTRGRQDRAE
jgi:hypothetical protein